MSNSSIQNEIVSKHFLDNKISTNTYFSINNFDYNIFSGQLNTDLYLIQHENNKIDTLFVFPNLDIQIGLFNILFSNDLDIEKLHIISPTLTFSNQEKDQTDYVKDILIALSSLNKKISVSNLKFTNINMVNSVSGQSLIDSLNLELNSIFLSKNFLDIASIQINRDSSYINAVCSISDEKIILDLNDAHIHSLSPFFDISSFTKKINNQNLDFYGTILLDQNNCKYSAEITYANSLFNFNIIDSKDSLFLQINDAEFYFHDFDSLVAFQKYSTIDSLHITGNVAFSKSDTINKLIYGSINTDYGKVDGYLSVDSVGESIIFGELSDFDLSFLSQKNIFGKINSNFKLSYKDISETTLDATIENLTFYDHQYSNILINGKMSMQKDHVHAFDLDVDINDNNLKAATELKFESIDFFNNTPILITAKGKINRLKLDNSNYLFNDSLDFISTDFQVNEFNLSFFDPNYSWSSHQPNPIIEFSDIHYSKNKTLSYIQFINLNLDQEEIFLDSSCGSIYSKISKQNNNDGFYFFNFLYDLNQKTTTSSFLIDVNLHKASLLSDLFFNRIQFNDSLQFNLDYKDAHQFNLAMQSPSIEIADIQFLNISISTKNNNIQESTLLIDQIIVSDEISLEDVFLQTIMKNDNQHDYVLKYSSSQKAIKEGLIQGEVEFLNDTFFINFFNNSFVHFSNEFWELNPESKLIINNNVEFKNFSLHLDDQEVTLDGMLDKMSNLAFSFKNFHIKHLNLFLRNKYMFFEGVLDGDIVFNQASFPMVAGDFEVNQFTFNNVPLGKLKLTNSSNQFNDSIYTNGFIQKEKQIMTFFAQYPLNGTKNIKANIAFNEFPSEVLDLFINPVSNIKGTTTGLIKLDGSIDNYQVSGQTKINNLGFEIPYLKTYYSNNQNSLILDFQNDSIFVKDFVFLDTLHNTSAVFDASIYHEGLRNMSYKLTIDSDSLFALNTHKNDNDHYYGSAFLGGNMLINGNPNNIMLDINGRAQHGSKLMIPLSKSTEIRENQFIQFSDDIQSQSITGETNEKSKFNMNFNLEINNDSEIQLIFDEEIGDLIKGHGEGSLYLKINNNGDFEVFGDFIITKGNYLFTLQDVITKSFDIENGGLIRFNGNPYNALIDLNLLYNVQASLNPLNPDYDRNVKSPVVCRMEMSEALLNPEINFFIDIPNSDQIVETSLETLTNTEQKLLEQFLYLLIANSFLIENDPSIDYLGNTLATTGTELLSNQLSNWLSQTTDAFDLGFKWVPGTGDSLSYQQIELAISKKFLDDRVVVNGHVGTPPDQSEADIVGDVDIEYDFFRDGRFKLRVFNRAKDYDPLSDSLGYEQGFGIFFKKQFNSFKDLFRSKKNKQKDKTEN